MKKLIFLTALFCIAFTGKIFSQVSISLAGYPLSTTGWTLGGTSAAVVDSEIELTNNTGSQNGHIYYNTIENVTACGQFTVDFDYKISYTSGCLGDGIGFYFINPMTGFAAGGGLGMPSPLTGLVFTMDTYDNDLDGNNPEDELMGYTSATVYAEGAAAYHVSGTGILAHQTYMADGNWHHVHISYNGGTIRVYVNGSTTPNMTGTFPITTAGYFGFSAGTGACISTHYIKSVYINSNTISAILGTTTVCVGSTTALSDSTTGGTWTSSNTAVGTVGASSGIVTGIATGTTVITYTYNSGACYATTTVNVVTPPGIISGTTNICVGTSTTFTDGTPGGTWTSSAPANATVGSSSGLVTGVAAGTAIITYSTGGTCYVTIPVTVSPMPTSITGSSTVCAGATTTLTDGLGSGIWSSSALSTATAGSSSGIVAGVAPGVVTITYAVGICSVTKVMTVNASPLPITGTAHVCIGFTTLLADATPSGTWSSVTPLIAPISSGGLVSGDATGTSLISYTIADGCAATVIATVNGLPSGIIGPSSMCVGTTAFLIEISPGGTWSSSLPSVATVGSSTGLVTGISAGTAVITDLLPTGCYTTFTMLVNPSPGPIAGSLNACVGSADTLYDGTPGGIWFAATIAATINPGTGVVTGVAADTVTISYTLGTCSATAVVTVNNSGTITCTDSAECAGSCMINLYGSGGGTWNSSNITVASVGAGSGMVCGVDSGTALISYTLLSTGCTSTQSVTINPLPSAISGPSSVCEGLTIAETDPIPGGTWSISPATTVASISPTGIVTGGTSSGTVIISYTGAGGCMATKTITVNSSPLPITTTLNHICPGTTTILTDLTTGGAWSFSPGATGTISATGVVTGIASGTGIATYSLGAGCLTTMTITVNPLPAAIGGATHACVGSCTLLTDVTGGGAWTTSSPTVSIGTPAGTICGVSTGIATIDYTVTSTGCFKSNTLTVNPLPPLFTVTGGGSYCAGGTGVHVGLSGSSSGINYVLYVGATVASGLVAGTGGALDFGLETTAGTYTVVATNPTTSCSVTMTGSAIIVINPLPPSCTVTGGGSYCAGGTGRHIGLSCSSVGINYQLMNGVVPVVTLAGTGGALDFGLQTAAGTYTVVATNPLTGCSATMTGSVVIVINPLPAAIGGPTALCPGTTITCTDATTGGAWTSSPSVVGTIASSSGVLSGIITGTVAVTYTLPTTCFITETVTVSPAPGPIIGPAVVCVGQSLTLSDVALGGSWTSSNPSAATIGTFSGIINGIATGTTTITYSLGTGCTVTKAMTVSPASPPISGPHSVCDGSSITLTYGGTSPTWGSSAPAIASISGTGVVTGISPGVVVFSCPTIGTGCPSNYTVTVNPIPTIIGGPSTVCVGSTVTETNGLTGGIWTTTSGNITIGSSSGNVTGTSGGTAVITYASGTCISTRTITVNPLATITGTPGACVGLTTTLVPSPTGGTWGTTNPGIATVSPAGLVTGVVAGIDTIMYIIAGTGCVTDDVVTINPLPSGITGGGSICVGATLILSDVVTGGTWSSLTTATAIAGSTTGIVTGVAPGVATIVYTVGGCNTSTTVTVIAAPAPISGITHVCVGSTVSESDPSAGGIWVSENPSYASVASSSGVVTGISSGTVIISYVLGTGCAVVTPVVVNPISPILGIPSACVGETTELSDSTHGGSWSSSTSGIATITGAGLVTGVATGVTTISYTLLTGCMATEVVTVYPLPLPISGPHFVCEGSSVTLTDMSPSGSWSSANPGIATVSGSGVVTGVTAGSTLISYISATGCFVTYTFTVNALPAPISGPDVLCVGNTVPFGDLTSGGVWSSSLYSVALISSTGLVTGLTPGSATISYTLSTGCITSMPVTVNTAVPAITGGMVICVGGSTTLSDALPGGAWGCSISPVATIDPVLGTVSGLAAGNSIVTYSTGTGCSATAVVTVNPLPDVITGSPEVCQGATTTLTDLTTGGSWTSSDYTIAPIDVSSGVVTGLLPGGVTITYTLGTGCNTTFSELVNPAPAPIGGFPQVCVGLTTSLSDATFGGAWSSSNPAAGTIDPMGIVYGIGSGTTTISYTLSTGCAADVIVTVNPFPTVISGSSTVCQGSATTFTDGVAGGAWTSSDPSTASVGLSSGIITGILPGSVTITYTVGAGCSIPKDITVNPVPSPISGPTSVCATQSIGLSDPTPPGGSWSSTSPAIAMIGAVSGVLTGVAAGTATISYSNSFGCAATYIVTVNPMPSAITGNTNVCLGGNSTLSDAVGDSTWISANPAVAIIGATNGIVTGVSLGSATIIYTLPAGCTVSTVVHVYPLPATFTVSGTGSYCAGGAGVPVFLSGSAVGVNYLLYRGITATGTFAGTGSPMDFRPQTVAGTYTVVAISVATGCSVNMAGSASVTITPVIEPSVGIHGTPGDTVCAGTVVAFNPLPVNGGSGPAYQWNVNGVNVATGNTYSFIPANNDTVKVTMTSNAACAEPPTANKSIIMVVNPFGRPAVDLSADPGSTVCKGSEVTVSAAPTYGGPSPVYTWMKNGTSVASGASYTFVPVNNDVLYCIMNSNYQCQLAGIDTSSDMVMTVDTGLTPLVSINANPGTLVNPGENLTLTAIVSNGGSNPTYQWFINGVPVPGATGSSFTHSNYSYPKDDSVVCQVTSSGMCPVTSFEWVYITVAPVGVNQLANTGSDINVLPNPNKGEFMVTGFLSTQTDEDVSMEITDILGQVVYKKKVTAQNGRLNEKIILANTANGMYILTLHSDIENRVFHIVVEQ